MPRAKKAVEPAIENVQTIEPVAAEKSNPEFTDEVKAIAERIGATVVGFEDGIATFEKAGVTGSVAIGNGEQAAINALASVGLL